jgi:hypothetical protein
VSETRVVAALTYNSHPTRAVTTQQGTAMTAFDTDPNTQTVAAAWASSPPPSIPDFGLGS